MVTTVAETREFMDVLMKVKRYPITLFKFDSSEQNSYREFLDEYSLHQKKMKEIGFRNSFLLNDERNNGQKILKSQFYELMRDYFGNNDLLLNTFFAGYSDRREVSASTIYYKMSNDPSIGDMLKVHMWFYASKEALSCKSYLEYSNSLDKHRYNHDRKNTLFDLFHIFPLGKNCLSSIKDEFIYFAPLDKGVNLMQTFSGIIQSFGEERLDKLKDLRKAYSNSYRSEYNNKEAEQRDRLRGVYAEGLNRAVGEVVNGFKNDSVRVINPQMRTLH